MKKTNKTALSTILAMTLLSGAAFAGETTGHVSLSSEYMVRGVSLSDHDPSVGLGVAHQLNKSVSFGSNLNTVDIDGDGVDTEIEVFGVYSMMVQEDVSLDLGVSQWLYTGNSLASELDYTELFASVSTQGFTVTNRWTNDFLGTDATHTVIEIGYTQAVPYGDISFDFDWNHTLDDDKFDFDGEDSYVHWRVGYDYMATEDVMLTVAYDGTNAENDFGDAGEDRLSASVSWSF
jgi:uncharacterized protein (TIGR02001 family)